MRHATGLLILLIGAVFAACPGGDSGTADDGASPDAGHDAFVPDVPAPLDVPAADDGPGTDPGGSACVALPPGPAAAVRTGNDAILAMLDWTRQAYPAALWNGLLTGTSVGRDGRTGASWNGGFCGGTDHGLNLIVSASQPGQFVTGVCVPGRCASQTAFAPPAIDSPQAILAAYPDDPADTVYGLALNLYLDDSAYWTVTNMTTGAFRKVDVVTGAVLP